MKLQSITDTVGSIAVGTAVAMVVTAVFMAIAIGGTLTGFFEKSPSPERKQSKGYRSPALSHSF